MKANSQNLLSKRTLEWPMQMRQHSRPQLSLGSANLRDDRIDAVSRSSGHQSDDHFRANIAFFERHQRRLNKALTTDKVPLSN
jgi:hypothetical protein